MKIGRLWDLMSKYVEGYEEFDRFGGCLKFEYSNIILEIREDLDLYRAVTHGGRKVLKSYLGVYTLKPDGNKFILFESPCHRQSEEITLPHGAWCYSVWKAFQYLEDLDYFTNEAKELKIQEERDNVHNWFLRNRK